MYWHEHGAIKFNGVKNKGLRVLNDDIEGFYSEQI